MNNQNSKYNLQDFPEEDDSDRSDTEGQQYVMPPSKA